MLPETEVLDAAVKMLTTGVRHLVVTRHGHVTSVVSIRDALAALVGAVTMQALAAALGPAQRRTGTAR